MQRREMSWDVVYYSVRALPFSGASSNPSPPPSPPPSTPPSPPPSSPSPIPDSSRSSPKSKYTPQSSSAAVKFKADSGVPSRMRRIISRICGDGTSLGEATSEEASTTSCAEAFVLALAFARERGAVRTRGTASPTSMSGVRPTGSTGGTSASAPARPRSIGGRRRSENKAYHVECTLASCARARDLIFLHVAASGPTSRKNGNNVPEPARALRRQRGARRHRPPQNGAGIRHLVVCAIAGWVHAEMVQLSDQGVTGLGDEESTAIGWLTAAVQKCARALDLARCLEGTLIGDGRALTI